jgi:hypothetical protein
MEASETGERRPDVVHHPATFHSFLGSSREKSLLTNFESGYQISLIYPFQMLDRPLKVVQMTEVRYPEERRLKSFPCQTKLVMEPERR